MEPMKVGFQAVLAPGYPCELLAGRLVPGHCWLHCLAFEALFYPAPAGEPCSKHLHFVQGWPCLSA